MSIFIQNNRYYLNIIPGVAAAQMFKTIAFTAFHGWAIAGVSALLGAIVGYTLCHYVRSNITKNRTTSFKLALLISIGISLPFIIASVFIGDATTSQNIDSSAQQKVIDWDKGVMTYPPVNQKQ